MTRKLLIMLGAGFTLAMQLLAAEPEDQLKVRISWGHQSPVVTPFYLRLLTNEIALVSAADREFEQGDRFENGAWLTRAGAGDVDALEVELRYPRRTVGVITNLHRIWADLIAR